LPPDGCRRGLRATTAKFGEEWRKGEPGDLLAIDPEVRSCRRPTWLRELSRGGRNPDVADLECSPRYRAMRP
jgi:hypothetical protein